MALGPGKYDPECTVARLATHAEGVALMVFGGKHGDGFSCQLSGELLLKLPTMLREMAKEIERSIPKA
jgi:hypothetical protein